MKKSRWLIDRLTGPTVTWLRRHVLQAMSPGISALPGLIKAGIRIAPVFINLRGWRKALRPLLRRNKRGDHDEFTG